jgi:hypothetical protein
MPLTSFLGAAAHTHAREEIFSQRLIYDLKIAAAHTRDYHLLNYYSDVDHDGFDAVFDDRDHVERVQLKTVTGGTRSWDNIRKYVLRPAARRWEAFYPHHFNSWGVEGGVILTEIAVAGGIANVTYMFTDLYVIAGIAANVIPRHHSVRAAANTLIQNLGQGASSESVTVTKRMFVTASSPSHLLALMRLHTDAALATNWSGLMLIYADHYFGNGQLQLSAPLPQLGQTILQMLQTSSGQQNP